MRDKEMKLETLRYYDEHTYFMQYLKAQRERHADKKRRRAKGGYYRDIMQAAKPYIPMRSNILCLGTRNNYEPDRIAALLLEKKVKAYSCDIGAASEADYLFDFNGFPKEWVNKWDVIFSNAIDHAFDATAAFFEWLRITRSYGILILEINTKLKKPNEADCCTFNETHLDEFFKQRSKNFMLIHKFTGSVHPVYIVRKI